MSQIILTDVPSYRPKVGQNARGVVETVRWFENSAGYIIIPVVPQHRCPFGFQEKTANTIGQIEQVSKRYAQQKQREFDAMDARDHLERENSLSATKDRLMRRMKESTCKPFEKDFIRASIARLERDIDRHKLKREFFFHQEAFEAKTVTE